MADDIDASHDDFQPQPGARLGIRELKATAGATPRRVTASGRVSGGRVFGAFKPAIRHNLRHLIPGQPTPRDADASRTHLNEVIAGAAGDNPLKDAGRIALSALKRATPVRKDATWGVEFVISAPADFARAEEFLRAGTAWLIEHKRATVISAVIHRDQGSPHVHLILWPVVDGRWVGSRLLDGWDELHQQFAKEVCARFGLRHATREVGIDRAEAARLVLDGPMRDSPARECPSWPEVEAAIRLDPLPWIKRWNLAVPTRKERQSPKKATRTFAQIMTGTGKKTAEDDQRRREPATTRQRSPVTPLESEPKRSNSIGVGSATPLESSTGATPNTGIGVALCASPTPSPATQTPAQLAWINRKQRQAERRLARNQGGPPS